jgi:dTDP-4-dehydrorhamnose 3,5-epimerase
MTMQLTRPIKKPLTCSEGIVAAAELALGRSEPVLHPVRIFADDRGWSMMNQFQEVLRPEGQINYSVQYPGVVKAWHRHRRQTDFWLCIRGQMKVGIYRERDDQAWMAIVGELSPAVIVIPPTLWHGVATVGCDKAGLLYYVTESYNPSQPDEERREWDSIEFPWAQINK